MNTNSTSNWFPAGKRISCVKFFLLIMVLMFKLFVFLIDRLFISHQALYIADYADGGQLEVGQWHQVVVSSSDLIPEGGSFNRINFAYDGGETTFYLDEIRFVASMP